MTRMMGSDRDHGASRQHGATNPSQMKIKLGVGKIFIVYKKKRESEFQFKITSETISRSVWLIPSCCVILCTSMELNVVCNPVIVFRTCTVREASTAPQSLHCSILP